MVLWSKRLSSSCTVEGDRLVHEAARVHCSAECTNLVCYSMVFQLFSSRRKSSPETHKHSLENNRTSRTLSGGHLPIMVPLQSLRHSERCNSPLSSSLLSAAVWKELQGLKDPPIIFVCQDTEQNPQKGLRIMEPLHPLP